jgi:hypothetical protein
MRRDLQATWLLLACLAAAGCARQPTGPAPVKTGAEDAARNYFEALVNRDWSDAYQALDSDSKARCPREQFAKLAENYYRSLGFEPTEAHVNSCDERGDEAVAHVTLKGTAGTSMKYYKDGVSLRRGGHGWAVVLPIKFGAGKPAKG